MNKNICTVTIGPQATLINENGETVTPPNGWVFLPAGDAALTRKVTSKGSYWRIQQKKGRRTFSKGVWTPSEVIIQAQNEIADVRKSDDYKKKMEYAALRREKKQLEYELDFCQAVEEFLNFNEIHKSSEKIIAKAVTAHAIPIGSGTVARTSMIPLEERAARAVIAWMRHNTTSYDQLQIKRIKGERRKFRCLLAVQSNEMLNKYRLGKPVDLNCPLQKVLVKILAKK